MEAEDRTALAAVAGALLFLEFHLFTVRHPDGSPTYDATDAGIGESGLASVSLRNLISLTDAPACSPFWYIRAIFVYALVSPCVYWLLKSKFGRFAFMTGLIAWGVVTNMSGIDAKCGMTYPYYSVLAFFVGGCLACLGMDMQRMCTSSVGICGLVAFIAYKGMVWHFHDANLVGIYGYVLDVLRLGMGLLPIVVGGWCSRWLVRSRVANACRNASFLFYAMHLGMLGVVTRMWGRLISYVYVGPMALTSTIAMSLITVIVCVIGVDCLCRKRCPALYFLMTGTKKTP